MDSAIRWSPRSTIEGQQSFLIADVAGNSLRHCRVTGVKRRRIEYEKIAAKNGIPNYTAFDWSREDDRLVATADGFGTTRILRLDSKDEEPSGTVQTFRIRQERKCNSLAWSSHNLLASAYDKARTDASLNVYDLARNDTTEPIRRLANADNVANVKFFPSDPDILLAGISQPKQGAFLRLYDLRDPGNRIAAVSTRHCHLLSIDPLDENYFASAGPVGEPVISIWDRRSFSQSTNSMPALSMSSTSGSVLEIQAVISPSPHATIWSLRYSGYRRGCFAVLSSAGQIRLFDTGRWTPRPDTPYLNHEDVGFDGIHYMKSIEELQKPWPGSSPPTEHGPTTRPIAFDFASPGPVGDSFGTPNTCLVSMRNDKTLEVVKIPGVGYCDDGGGSASGGADEWLATFRFTGDRFLYHLDTGAPGSGAPVKVIANIDLLQPVGDDASQEKSLEMADGMTTSSEAPTTERKHEYSSLENHERFLGLRGPPTNRSFEANFDLIDTDELMKHRCKSGYMFDSVKNKEVVKEDPWLIEMWEVIKRLEDMARNSGMVHETLDLSYLGVFNIWNAEIGPNGNRRIPSQLQKLTPLSEFDDALHFILLYHGYESFKGAETQFPLRRQVGLAMCGWKFSESRLRAKCAEIYERGDYYKAIVVAFCHDRRDIAIEMLKEALRSEKLTDSSLALVMAGDVVAASARSLCSWMAADAKDPYLKALLTYFTAGGWSAVVAMRELPLPYRVALALKHLKDDDVKQFVQDETEYAIQQGDIEGIILTGLSENCMDLFHNWIVKTGDVQTPLLASARTNPRYVTDPRWGIWRETYSESMQRWRTFVERLRFNGLHRNYASSSMSEPLVKPDPSTATLRCSHCLQNPARGPIDGESRGERGSFSSQSTTARSGPPKAPLPAPTPSSHAGTVCPNCRRRIPTCAICMLPLGSLDPYKQRGSMGGEQRRSLMATFCAKCNHGTHSREADAWFAIHKMCPVSDCKCVCKERE